MEVFPELLMEAFKIRMVSLFLLLMLVLEKALVLYILFYLELMLLELYPEILWLALKLQYFQYLLYCIVAVDFGGSFTVVSFILFRPDGAFVGGWFAEVDIFFFL